MSYEERLKKILRENKRLKEQAEDEKKLTEQDEEDKKMTEEDEVPADKKLTEQEGEEDEKKVVVIEQDEEDKKMTEQDEEDKKMTEQDEVPADKKLEEADAQPEGASQDDMKDKYPQAQAKMEQADVQPAGASQDNMDKKYAEEDVPPDAATSKDSDEEVVKEGVDEPSNMGKIVEILEALKCQLDDNSKAIAEMKEQMAGDEETKPEAPISEKFRILAENRKEMPKENLLKKL